MNNTEIVKPTNRIRIVPIIIMIGLLFLRFPFIFACSYKIITMPHAFEAYIDFTYLLTGCLIIYERDKLINFNIGLSSVAIFILVPILKPLVYFILKDFVPFKQGFPFSWFQIIIAVILLAALIYTHPSIYKGKIKDLLKWLFISVIIGILFAVALSFAYQSFSERGPMKASFPIFIYLFITQLNNAALSEEPLFRGFIWGYLRKRNWKEYWILLFQAFLFSLGHIYYLPDLPIAFIGTFAAGLVLGLVVCKSKNISTSIIVHGLINSIGDLVMHFIW